MRDLTDPPAASGLTAASMLSALLDANDPVWHSLLIVAGGAVRALISDLAWFLNRS